MFNANLKTCAAWVKDRGRGVYTKGPCHKPATDGIYCARHAKAHRNAVAKMKAYSKRAD